VGPRGGCALRGVRTGAHGHHLLARGGASGKNSRYFHTQGYENIFLQKLDFFHTQKILFHTLKNNFIPSKKI
jgi:hypothetical protein